MRLLGNFGRVCVLVLLSTSFVATASAATKKGSAAPKPAAATAPAAPAAAAPAAPAAPAEPADAAKTAAPASSAPAAPSTGPAATPDTAAAPAATGGGAGTANLDQGGYTVRLRTLEKNVNELKEQIFRTKARLNLLKETVLGGVIGASRAVIKHKNEMGSSFKLVKAIYALDGVQILAKSDETGHLAEMTEFDVYNGAIQPGSHTLTVVMIYQGNGFGVFSYLKGYKFTVKSSHNFVAGEGKGTQLTVVGYEKGNITTNLQDRPAIDFRVNILTAESSPAAASAAPAK